MYILSYNLSTKTKHTTILFIVAYSNSSTRVQYLMFIEIKVHHTSYQLLQNLHKHFLLFATLNFSGFILVSFSFLVCK